MNNNPLALSHEVIERGEAWAEAECEARRLEEIKCSVKSQICVTLMKHDKFTAARAQMEAEASKEYQDHIHKMVEARKVANVQKVKLDAAKIHIELVRTFESSERARMQLR